MIVPLLIALALSKQSLKLSSLFSDNMVLQRNVSVPFYGTAAPNETVAIQVAGQSVTTEAGADGKWFIKLAPMRAGGPYTASIQSPTGTLNLKNVMVGEVWLCSGQSNMELRESAANDYPQALEEANPSIRMFTVGQAAVEEPANDVRGVWLPATKHSVGYFSAVAWSFGRELQNRLNVPIGLIASSWGGTKAESWTPREAMATNPALRTAVDEYLNELKAFPSRYADFRSNLKEWMASRADSGNEGFLKGWENRVVDETSWNKVNLPGTIDTMEPSEEGSPFDGSAWFRRTFVLPETWAGKALKLELGPIADYDDAYVNGTKVGYTKSNSVPTSTFGRTYRISPGILLRGENSIAIRVYAAQGACGFTGLPDQMRITLASGESEEELPLAGEWREKVERKIDTSLQAPHLPMGPGNPKGPGSLFNGMIAPLMPYGIRGVIWYQGESNVDQASQYQVLFPTLIREWRNRWNQGQFPFYFVQLPNYHATEQEPGESNWAELREAQAATLKLTNTGMANTIDLGDATTIHPKNKREVGQRLAAIALSKDYGVHEPWSGPTYQYMSFSGRSVRIYFQHVEEKLTTKDNKLLTGFAIAGQDRKFYWAAAKIEGTSIVLSCPEVPEPKAVRYGWADNPNCNLYNSAGIPAVPFRTDNWIARKTTP